jgi:hypothetical protein
MAPLSVRVDGVALVPTEVHAKIGLDDVTSRPSVVVLVTYSIPRSGQLEITSKDPRSTRISWQDGNSHRVDLSRVPAQAQWHEHAASFLLSLAAPSGGSACGRTSHSD